MTKPGYKIGHDGRTTARQREVLDLLRQGLSHVEIADVTGVSKQRVGQIELVLIEKGLWQRPAVVPS